MSPQKEPNIDLKEIANAMTEFSIRHMGSTDVGAGMTYIGQMISHDIVPPTSKNSHSRTVTPYLNLDSIYGDSPSHIFKFVPEQSVFLDDTGRFKMSEYRGILDLKRRNTRNGWEAVIPEPRNDENRIISQLHLFWQMVHNWLLDEEYAEDALEAQKYTTLLFQLVVIEGFCKSFFTQKVFELFFPNELVHLQLQDHYEAIPDFFSKASFRFGHSIVRSLYTLNLDYPGQNVGNLFGKNVRLKKEFVIDWKLFFLADQLKNKALKVDTYVIESIRDVPNIALKSKINISDVIEFNLQAGRLVQPFEGDNFVKHLQSDERLAHILSKFDIVKLTELDGATFEHVGGITHLNLPLWPYLLLEAEQQELGIKLGPLGSFLNARVLYSAINHSRFSVIGRRGYNFEEALKMLPSGLSTKLKETMELISSNQASAKTNMHPVMEALISLVNE